jgi:hypothetical protein
MCACTSFSAAVAFDDLLGVVAFLLESTAVAAYDFDVRVESRFAEGVVREEATVLCQLSIPGSSVCRSHPCSASNADVSRRLGIVSRRTGHEEEAGRLVTNILFANRH